MVSATVCISKQEYERLKKIEEIDYNLIEQLVESLQDVKMGRIRRVA